ncbi:MAG: sensor histidine kinase, partial [Gammaproteobacteria bacterium]
MFQWLAMAWGSLSLLLLVGLPTLRGAFARFSRTFVLTRVLVDICVLAALIFASGGAGSGLGPLLLPTMVMAAILLAGPEAQAAPATATLTLLYAEFHLSLSPTAPSADYVQAGVLGAACFALTLIAQWLSRRIRANDRRSLTQAAEVADLQELNRQIVSRMRTGIVVINDDHRIRLLNDAARELSGSAVALVGRELPGALAAALLAWRADPKVRAEPMRVDQRGPTVRVNFAYVRPGQPDSDVIAFLEDAAELNQQAQRLKLAALGQLSANIAHEIRNPLSAISHAAELLAESPNLASTDARLTTIILDHVQRMNRLVQNVLQSSRPNPPEPILIALNDTLPRLIQRFQESVPDTTIDCHVDPVDLRVRMDPQHLDQVLSNLLQNAVRYSHKQTGQRRCCVEAHFDADSRRPKLSVLDDGPGVDPLHVERLFEPFFTSDSLSARQQSSSNDRLSATEELSSNEKQGTGLGLYLSRELCEANQAQLRYHPRDTGGACVT